MESVMKNDTVKFTLPNGTRWSVEGGTSLSLMLAESMAKMNHEMSNDNTAQQERNEKHV